MKKIIIALLVVAILAGLGLYLTRPRHHTLTKPNATVSNSQSETVAKLQKMKASDIKYDETKINVYIFWGDGCSHCKALGNFIKEIEPEYSKYFDLYTLEVWYDSENSQLMAKTAETLNERLSGVPFMIIGDKSYFGYNPADNEGIKQAIKEAYASPERFDAIRKTLAANPTLLPRED